MNSLFIIIFGVIVLLVIAFVIFSLRKQPSGKSGKIKYKKSRVTKAKTSPSSFDNKITSVNELSIYDLPTPFDLTQITEKDIVTDDINLRLKEISEKLHVDELPVRNFLAKTKSKKIAAEKLPGTLIDYSSRYLGLQKAFETESANETVAEFDQQAAKFLSHGNLSEAEKQVSKSEEHLLETSKEHENPSELVFEAAKKRAQRAEINLLGMNHRGAGGHYDVAGKMLPEGKQFHKVKYLLNASKNYSAAKLYDKAISLVEDAIGLAEKHFGADHQLVAEALNVLGSIYTTTRKYDSALTALQRALSILESVRGTNSVEVGETLSSLGETYASKNNFAIAIGTFERSLHIFEDNYGSLHDLVISTLNNLVALYKKLGKYEQAEKMLLSYLKKLTKKKGTTNDIKIATVKSALAGLYIITDQLDDAEVLYQETLAINARVYGEDHPEVARTLNNLGTIEQRRENFEKSADYLRNALRIVKKHFPPDHISVKLVAENFNFVIKENVKQGSAQPNT